MRVALPVVLSLVLTVHFSAPSVVGQRATKKAESFSSWIEVTPVGVSFSIRAPSLPIDVSWEGKNKAFLFDKLVDGTFAIIYQHREMESAEKVSRYNFKKLDVGGCLGEEWVVNNSNPGWHQFSRWRAVVTDKGYYQVIVASKTLNGLFTPIVERFFASFKLIDARCQNAPVSNTTLPSVAVSGRTLSPKEIAQKAFPSVVILVTEDSDGKASAVGSGFFIRKDVVATSYHVIKDAKRIHAKLVGGKK